MVRYHEVSKPQYWYFKYLIAVEFDRCLGNYVAETSVIFQSDWIILTKNLVDSNLHDIFYEKFSYISYIETVPSKATFLHL